MQASRALRELARVPSRVAPEVARGLKRELLASFARGEDPYGNRWAPLRPATLAKGRRPPPLTDTTAGKRGIVFSAAQGAGVRILSTVPYMRYHMRATPRRVARKFLPEGRLPARWLRVWDAAVQREAREVLRG